MSNVAGLACIDCSMQALADGKPVPYFYETVEEHMARVHPDLEQTRLNREKLERQLREKLK